MAQQYTLVVLNTNLAATASTLSAGINNARQVAGTDYLFSGPSNAAVWNGVALTDLGQLPNTSGFAGANAINNHGVVVGWDISAGPQGYQTYPYGATFAAIFSAAGATPLASIGYLNDSANGINDYDEIVGFSQGNDQSGGKSITYPVIWTHGSPTALPTLGGTSGSASGINNAGQVAGYAQLAGDAVSHAVIWNSGVPTDLGTLGGTNSAATAINAGGQVVGWADTSSGAQDATIWNGTTATDLGPGIANAVNKYGQAVGQSSSNLGISTAMLWENGHSIDLTALIPVAVGVTLDKANGINDCGWIVADGIGPLYNTGTNSFLLIPVPDRTKPIPGC
jgi:probable HAF family extracellular repeat protein